MLWIAMSLGSPALASDGSAAERLGPGPTPLPVVLSVTSEEISSVSLQWTQSLDPRLERYELWRWSARTLSTGGSRGSARSGLDALSRTMAATTAAAVVKAKREGCDLAMQCVGITVVFSFE